MYICLRVCVLYVVNAAKKFNTPTPFAPKPAYCMSFD